MCRSWLRKAHSELSLTQWRITGDVAFASSQYWETLYGSKWLIGEKKQERIKGHATEIGVGKIHLPCQGVERA